MRKRLVQMCVVLVLVMSMLAATAGAETVRGDLSKRLGNMFEQYEYNGTKYNLRTRTSAVLALAIDVNEHDLKLAEFARLLLVDDEQKIFAMLNIPANTLIQVADGEEEELKYMRFGDVYQMKGTPEENCQRLLDAVNRLLGGNLVESYIAFDLEGATVLTGGVPVEGTTREKLRTLQMIVDEMTTDELNDTYALLGDYIITNMKSGAVMKIIDKADRYERQDTVELPGEQRPTANNGPVVVADAQRLEEIKLAFFYKESAW